MAIFNSYLLGQVKKSVGNVTMYRSKKKNLARGKAISVRNPRTSLQVMHRAKFNRLVDLAGVFGGVMLKGFQTRSLPDARNEFVKRNLPLATVDDSLEVVMDFEGLVVSGGSLGKPNFTMKVSEGGKGLVFTKQEQVMMEGRQEEGDEVYAVVFESQAGETVLHDLGRRGEYDTQEVSLPEAWDVQSVYVYGFAVNTKRNVASKTLYVGCGADENV